jgi:hypothetical protein
MKRAKSFLALALSFSLYTTAFLNFTVQPVRAQQQTDSKISLQRGYRTGYTDGYTAGYRDKYDNEAKDYSRHNDYAKADRAFTKEYGAVEDYRDGYRQGFESGYDAGFEKRSFDAAIPVNLTKRGVVAVTPKPAPVVEETRPIENTTVNTAPAENTIVETAQPQAVEVAATETTRQAPVMTTMPQPQTENYSAATDYDDSTLTIPTDTELIVELVDDINTRQNREGDKFKARIVSPVEVGGAIVEGRITRIQRPGRIKRRAEMTLSFDRIVLSNNRWSNFNAVVTEVLPVRGDNVKRVDTEGTVEGKRTYKEDSIKVGAATGTGFVVGAVAGGPVGAAVGASVGAAFGVGAVVIERGKDIRLNKNQQLRIKTAYETQIR